MFASRKQKGFTLIELLIVAVILGILAAVVVPQFGSNTADTKNQALKSNLKAMRSAIDLYAQQHSGVYPGTNKASDGTAGGANADFVAQLTKYTDATGKTSNSKDAAYPFGPYLREIPMDPVKNSNAVAALEAGTDLTAVNAGVVTIGGWKFYDKIGRLIVNNSADDGTGTKYDKY